jgi:uncharacterized protein (DUF2062 family)
LAATVAIIIWTPTGAAQGAALARALERPDRLVLIGGTPGRHPAGQVRTLTARREGRALAEVAAIARRTGVSHIVWVVSEPAPAPAAVEQLIRAVAEHPDHILIGRGEAAAEDTATQRGARFWLRVQTGRRLKAPLTGLRVYPLAVVDHIRRRQAGPVVHTEILAKALWAEVPLTEIQLTPPPAAQAGRRGKSLWQSVYMLALNIHWSMRSILPIPHRKIVDAADRPGEKISVWRPLRSLRTLLRENITPGRLAASGALGVLLGTLPLIACHSMAILFASNYFRLNKVAALSASQLCMPPIVPALCIELGYWMRHGRFLTEISLETLGYEALERLYEWFLGSLVLAPLLALLAGGLILVLSWSLSKSMARITS